MLKSHPDRHSNAPWAVERTRCLLVAAAELGARRNSSGSSASTATRTGARQAHRRTQVRFYPDAQDWWADFGQATAPSFALPDLLLWHTHPWRIRLSAF